MDAAFYLSIILAVMTCVGMHIAGKGHWQGWAIGLISQPIWALFSIITKSYGLLITCAIFGFTYTKNLIEWKRKERLRDPQ